MSNALGTITPLRQLIDAAHAVGALVAIDAAQLAPHHAVDVTAHGLRLPCIFSGHKMLGPTASGGLYAKRQLLEDMDPMFGGGEMIREVFHDHSTWNDVPYKFEAGTMQIAQQVGLGAAIDYLKTLGMDSVRAHEEEITRYALDQLLRRGRDDIRTQRRFRARGRRQLLVQGRAPTRPGDDLERRRRRHPSRASLRSARHEKVRHPGYRRASFYVYNTKQEVDALVEALAKAEQIFTA